ncbi:hypothetical protein [Aquimarina algicola]|uniref:Uncharacterized protein n=1 Tax=Aquimarina algicola TaxID=2589995 RepID=A0A504JDJ5_9FLAO|nr:hypothetical protein [Aquimarina algicola]TPN85788.1 hypothetical protein FHK87_10890 [Aquimarina algicola]
METVFQNIVGYINSLDWAYILTFILISYALNHYKEIISKGLGINIRTRYLVLLVGVTYGIAMFFIRDYHLSQIEILLQSFVFAIVFHKLIIETLVERFMLKKDKEEPPTDELL